MFLLLLDLLLLTCSMQRSYTNNSLASQVTAISRSFYKQKTKKRPTTYNYVLNCSGFFLFGR